MILTGQAIAREVRGRRITISPFSHEQLNPNSYNYRLSSLLKVRPGLVDSRDVSSFNELEIPIEGMVFEPGRVYLGATREVIGSDYFVPSLIGRSSLGRLGVYLQISADLGNLGACHAWTLEIVVCQPIRLYQGMIVGQVSFWTPDSTDTVAYAGRFGRISVPEAPVAGDFAFREAWQ